MKAHLILCERHTMINVSLFGLVQLCMCVCVVDKDSFVGRAWMC